MWFIKKLAFHEESGQSLSVITPPAEWDERVYPTMFFTHFDTVPTYNVATQCLDTLDLKEFTNGLSKEEEKIRKIFSDSRSVEEMERRGVEGNSKEGEEWD